MDKPLLSPMQRAWLREIGIDARMLAHFSAGPFVPPTPEAAAPAGATVIAELLKRAPLPQPPVEPPRLDAPAPGDTAEVLHAGDAESLDALRGRALGCTACGLHEVRGRVVFGEGVPAAPKWMFIGEAPGEYDDSTGQPFGGRPGELLRAMLASVGIVDGASSYFTNVLKCRPMGNRSPQADEIAACLPLLRQQIRLLRPACLVALGRVSAGVLLGRDDDLDALRGQLHAYVDEDGRGIPVVVTHHPAALLLHGQLKADAWRDLNLLPGLPG